MFKNLFCLLILFSFCLPLAAKSESELVFICHKGLRYSRGEVKATFRAYLDEPRPVDNKNLFPEMLKVIDYSAERYHKIWDKNFFRRALFVPKMMDNDGAVINWVASIYGGVGYVHAAPHDNPNVEVCGQ